MTEKHDKDFKNYAKCLIWDHVDGNVKVRDHCQVTGKYRGSAHEDCNIKVKSRNSFCIS